MGCATNSAPVKGGRAAGVVAVAGADGAEVFPAASKAATVYVWEVALDNPLSW